MVTQRKRQRKGEVQEEYKCNVANCNNKVYLSYPAFSTHIKNKHGNEFIGNMQDRQLKGIEVGQKEKIYKQSLTNRCRLPFNQGSKLRLNSQLIDNFLLELVEMDCKSVLQQETDVIKNSQILNCVGEVFKVIEELYKGNLNENQFLEQFTECLENQEQKFNIDEEEALVNVSCDEAISFFLKELSYTVNLKFLQNIFFCLLFVVIQTLFISQFLIFDK